MKPPSVHVKWHIHTLSSPRARHSSLLSSLRPHEGTYLSFRRHLPRGIDSTGPDLGRPTPTAALAFTTRVAATHNVVAS
jgi:hypothetical protein